MKRSLSILLFLLPVVLLGQNKKIKKSIRLLPYEFTSRGLIDLESDTNGTCYRIWLEPDLVISVKEELVELTLYIGQHDRKKGWQIATGKEKFVFESDSKLIFNYLNEIDLSNWDDSRTPKSGKATGVIHDGIKIIIEYSDKDNYRNFGLYSPVADKIGF